MKYCEKCNINYFDEDLFCPNCMGSLKPLNESNKNDNESTTAFTLDRTHNLKKYITSIILYFVSFYIISSIFTIIYEIIYMAIMGYTLEDLENPIIYDEYYINVISVTNFATYVIAMILIIPILYNVLKKDLNIFTNNVKDLLKWTGIGFALLYIGTIAGNIIVLLLTINLPADGMSDNQEAINKILSSGGIHTILIGFVTIILAPILEELIFRKSLFGLFKKCNVKTVILSAVVFASIHVVPACLTMLMDVFSNGANPIYLYIEAIYIFSYLGQGIALSYIYYKTNGNIIPCILVHMANNLIAFIVNYNQFK